MKKWLGWSIVILVFLFVALQAILIFYHDDLQLKVERSISRSIHARVRFDEMNLSVWRHFPNVTLELRNLTITGRKEFQHDTLLSVASLGLELDLFRFFKDEIRLKSILLDQPQINLLVLENGHANYDVFTSDSDSTQTDTTQVHVDIEQLVINEGELIYEDRINKALVHIADFQHKGTGDFAKEVFDYSTTTFFRELTVDYGDVRYLDKKQTSVDLSMKIDTRTNRFSILENSIVINHFKVGLEGYVTLLPDGYDMDLRFAAHETSLKHILSVMPGFFIKDMEHISTGGEAAFRGYINGRYTNNNDTLPAFRMDLTIKDGFFKIDTLPEALNKIQCELSIDHLKGPAELTSFDLKNIHFELGDQPVHGHIKVQGLDQFTIDADLIAGLNLHEIETFYPIKDLEIKGRADLEFKANGKFVRGIENGPNKRPIQIPPFSIDVKLKEGGFKYDTLPAGLSDVKFHLIAKNPTGKAENTSFHLENMRMKLDSNSFAGYVRVDGFSDFKIDADIKANLNIADLERMIPIQGMEARGKVNLDVKAKGDYDFEKGLFPALDANFDLTNGYLKSNDYPEPIQDIHLIAEAINKTGRVQHTELLVKQFTYTLEGEPFTVTGSVTDFDKYEFDFKIKGDVDLEKITKIYPIKGMNLSGKIFTHMETKGKLADLEAGRYELISNTGGVRMKNVNVVSDKIPVPIYIEEAIFGLTPEKIILKSSDATIGKSHVSMTGDLFNYMYFLTRNNDLIRGDLKLECDTLDINEWMPAVKKTGTPVATDTIKKVPQQIAVIEIPKNVDFVFDSDIKNVRYDDVHISDLDGEIRIKEGVMTLHETGFNSLNAKFAVDGDYNTQDMNHPLFDFGLNIQELDIAKAYKEIKLIRDLAPAAADCEGQFSIEYKLKGELARDMNPKTETIIGGGRMRIANAKIDGMKIFEELSKAAKRESMNNPHLKDFVMDTEIHDNRLYVKPFSIKVSGFNTEIEGVSEISGAIQYLVKIELLPIEKLAVPFHVTGTYDNPKVAIGKGHKLPE